MKKHATTIIAVMSCLLTVICIIQIITLKNQISSMQSNLSSQIGSVNVSVNNIYSNINTMFEDQANLLADKSFAYGDLDTETMMVELICSVIPKEFSPLDTTAVLFCNNQEYPMISDNGAFSATLALPVFSQSDVTRVQFTENGVARTQSLDWSFAPRYDFLPDIFTTFSGSASSSGGSYHRQGLLDVYINGKQPVEVRSVALVEVLDGKEMNRTPIELNEDETGREYYPAEPVDEIKGMGQSYHGSYGLDETYEIPNGSTHELYIEVADGYDLHYRVLVDRWNADENGGAVPDEGEWIWQSRIYDAAGNLLYKAN